MKPKNKKSARKSFAALFAEAKQRDAYWVADAIYTFTEELHNLAEAKGLSRADLARRLEVSPAYITKVFRGDVNFTIETMVRLVRALGGKLHLHLAPEEQKVSWVPWHSPARPAAVPGLRADTYKTLIPEEVTEGHNEAEALAA
jgi:transcriptional regulator with XRE-family HTH domain